MHARWFNVAVVLLWLASMSWLMLQKVLPPLLVGEPPSYRTILQAQRREPPVGWRILLNDKPLGWALSSTSPLPQRMTEVRCRVHFYRLPLGEVMPGWGRSLLQLIDPHQPALEIETESVVVLDALERLSHFESSLLIGQINDRIRLEGTVDGNNLRLVASVGDLPPYRTERFLPANALLGDALSPQTQLPGLRTGQTWTVPVYSLLRPPNDPMEILQATVEGTEPIVWNGSTEEAWLVTYRADPGSGSSKNRPPREKLLVRHDGTVVKQQVAIFDSVMTFVRLSDDETIRLREMAAKTPSPKYRVPNQKSRSETAPDD